LLLHFCVFHQEHNTGGLPFLQAYSTNSFDVFGHQYFRIEGSRYSGLDLEYLFDKTFGLSFSYARQETEMKLPCYSEERNTTIEHFEFGFTARNWIMEKKLEWITGLGFGACKLFKDPHEQGRIKIRYFI
jgi:hypothetical protein